MRNISIFTLVLISTTATTTTSGFTLGLTTNIVNDNLTRCCSAKKTQSTLFAVFAVFAVSSSSSCTDRICERTPNIRYKPSATTQIVQATTHMNKETHQVKKTGNNKRNRIAPLVTSTTSLCLLSIILRRPDEAHAAAAATNIIIPPSPLSSIELIDPAILTSSTTVEGMTALNSNNINILNHNNKMVSLLLTTLATIQMKQQSMTMFALALGMTMVLLSCAEGGYVKFVEFVTNKCLAYYGMINGERKREKKVGWNEYVLLLPRQRRVVAKNDNSDKEIVLDGKTMLFHQHSAKKKVARDDVMMEKANQSYREKQYEQHHHLLQDETLSAATTTTTAASSSSSTNIVSTISWDKYKTTLHKHTQTQVDHGETTSDKLQIMKNLVTWEDYKHLVTELQRKKEECSKLQEKVDSLTRLLEVERTVNSSYRTAVPPVVGEDDNSDSSSEEEYDEELKSLVDKAKEYDETILQEESKMKNHHGDSVRWH